MKISNDKELMILWELLIRQLLDVREKLKIPWDDDMDEIIRNRDNLYLQVEKNAK